MIIAATIPITSLDSVSGVDSSAPIGPAGRDLHPGLDAGVGGVEHGCASSAVSDRPTRR